jgi:hypothetical protein
VDSDHYRHTNAIFDETQEKELTKKIYAHLERELFSISPELYPFLVYDYFTACFSVPEPDREGIAAAMGIFEPLFLFIYSRFRNIGDLANAEALSAAFGELLEFRDGRLMMTDGFRAALKRYFSRWKLTRDADMMLKGWWRFTTD